VYLGTYEVCLKSNEAGAIKTFLLTTELQINIIPFKVVPLGSRTPPEKLLPLPLAALEVFMLKCPQLVCHYLLDVVHSSKMTTFEVQFGFREMEEVIRTQIRRLCGLRNHWDTLFGQRLVHGDGRVTGSLVMMQHPSVRNLWPDMLNPFSEPFKNLTIVKQSHNRHSLAQSVPGGLGSQIS